MIRIAPLIMLIGCTNQPINPCVTEDDLVERWFEVSSIQSLENCYLLSSDFLMIEKNQDVIWGIGFWEIVDRDENCIYEVTLDGESAETVGNESGCVIVNYQSQEVTLCDCQY